MRFFTIALMLSLTSAIQLEGVKRKVVEHQVEAAIDDAKADLVGDSDGELAQLMQKVGYGQGEIDHAKTGGKGGHHAKTGGQGEHLGHEDDAEGSDDDEDGEWGHHSGSEDEGHGGRGGRGKPSESGSDGEGSGSDGEDDGAVSGGEGEEDDGTGSGDE